MVDVESYARTLRTIDRDLADAPRLIDAVASAPAAGHVSHVVYGSGNRHGRLMRVLTDADYRLVDVPGSREQLRLRLALDALDAARSPDPPDTLLVVADDLELGDLLRRVRGGPQVIVVGRRRPAIEEGSDRLIDADDLEALLPREPASRSADAPSREDRGRGPRRSRDSEPELLDVEDDEEDLVEDDDLDDDDEEEDDVYEEALFDDDDDDDDDDDEDDDDEDDDDDDEDEFDDDFDEEEDEVEVEDDEETVGARYATREEPDLELQLDEDGAGDVLSFGDEEEDNGSGVGPLAPGVADDAPARPRRRRSRGGRRRGRGAGTNPDQRGPSPVDSFGAPAGPSPVEHGSRPVAVAVAPRRAPSAPGDIIGLLREGLDRLLQGPPRLVWGTVLLEAMQELDPSFREGEPEFDSFDDLLEEAQRRGILRLERSPATDSYLVTAVAAV